VIAVLRPWGLPFMAHVADGMDRAKDHTTALLDGADLFD
jgi:hypothetical protein